MTNKSKHSKKVNTKNKMEGPMSKKTKEPPKRANQKGKIEFLNLLMLQEAYQIGKGEDLLKGGLALKNSHLLQYHISK
jgi:hypothetical protein